MLETVRHDPYVAVWRFLRISDVMWAIAVATKKRWIKEIKLSDGILNYSRFNGSSDAALPSSPLSINKPLTGSSLAHDCRQWTLLCHANHQSLNFLLCPLHCFSAHYAHSNAVIYVRAGMIQQNRHSHEWVYFLLKYGSDISVSESRHE